MGRGEGTWICKKTALLFATELVKRTELKLRSDCPKDFVYDCLNFKYFRKWVVGLFLGFIVHLKVDIKSDIDKCDHFLGRGGGRGLRVLSTPVQGTIDRTNTEMMNVRWCYFRFWKKIPQKPNRSTSLHVDAVLPDFF